MRARLRGGPAWLVLVAAVTAYEIATPADQLLTAACHRALAKHPVVTRAAIAITALHLAALLPRQVDPFALLSRLK
jgi:hypothetical protein